MNGEIDNGNGSDDVDDDIGMIDGEEDLVVADDAGDVANVGDISVEINVEELVANLEAAENDDTGRKHLIKQRLEELREQCEAEKDLDSTYNFNLDDDL